MSVDSLLRSVQQHIASQGGELFGVEELRANLSPTAPCEPRSPTVEGEWLRPDVANVKYSDVWIARTASGTVVLAHVTSHRRRNGRRNLRERPRWYGVDILTRREIRIVKVLDGSRR